VFKINRYILLFIAISFLAIGILWKVVQSERFASLIVNEVSKRFLDKENISFDVKKVEISLFPPSTDLRDLSLDVESIDFSLSIRSNRASIDFSFINLFSSDLVVDKIALLNSRVEFQRKLIEDTKKSDVTKADMRSSIKSLAGIVNQIHDLIPFSLNSLQLDRVKVVDQERHVEIFHSELRLYDNYLIGPIHLRDISLPSVKDYNTDLQQIDEVSMSLELADNYVNISDIEIRRMLDVVSGEVSLRFDNTHLQAKLRYSGALEWPISQLRRKTDLEIEATGYTESLVEVEGPIVAPKLLLDSKIYQLESKDLMADYLNIKARYEKGDVVAEEIYLQHNDGEASLAQDVLVYEKNKGLTTNKLKIIAENLSTETAFYAVRDVLGIVKGRMFGGIDLKWQPNNRSIEFTVPNQLGVRGFILGKDLNNPILQNPEVILSATQVVVAIDGGVSVSSKVGFGGSSFKFRGRVADNEIAFVTDQGRLDFSEFGPIAGVQIQGQGAVGLKVYGPKDDVAFDISVNTKDSSVLGYYLGEIKADLLYSLNSEVLAIKSLNGKLSDSLYQGKGSFIFDEGRSGFNLNIETEKMSYSDSKKILAPLFSLLTFVPEELSFLGKGKFDVKGDFEKNEVVVNGPLSLSYVNLYEEVIDALSLKVNFEEGVLSLGDILLEKGEGSLKGDFALNTRTNFIEYDARWENIKPNDFRVYRQLNLGLETNADLDLYGSGTFDNLTTRSKIVTNNSSVQGAPFGESEITVSGQSSRYEIEGQIFEESVGLSAVLDFEKLKDRSSSFDLDIKFKDVRNLLSVLSAHNSQREDLSGKLQANITSQFNINDLRDLSLSLNLNEFEVAYKQLNVQIEKAKKLEITNGEVQRSELGLKASGFYLTPVLGGDLKDGFSFDMAYRLPMSLLELFTPEVEVSKGNVYGVVTAGGTLSKMETYAEANIADVTMQTSYIPGSIQEGSVQAILDNQVLKFDSLNAKYGKGKVNGSGQVTLDFPFPIVSVKGTVSDAFIPLMSRSGMVVSGQFNLRGEELPYHLTGDVTVLFAEILEDINEFQKRQASTKSYQRFLPESENRQRELIDLDLNVNIQRPIQVRNSLLELNIDGQAQVTGPLSLPKAKGRFQVVPSTSKFKFKGHEFNLTKGTIALGDDFNREGAELDFSGVTQINEYRVRLGVSGRTKNVEVSLSSEPGLSQENLFSLLTLGVTSDVSTELDENERQSVATVGLGALLADQLKLTEGLDSSFGLRLSVLPEYAQESDTLLQGKSAVSDSSTSRFRSSTKVRVQKKISDKVDLSVSSTVGGSLEQRQKMNVNYKFDNKWSIEGVYELKSTEDEGVESSDSIGADLKYRWSF
jgi:translocation and assembly module TamB